MKVEKQHTSVELENFFIYGSKMRLFWQVTILVCVVNGKFNKEGIKDLEIPSKGKYSF